jgi:hypothetical protein
MDTDIGELEKLVALAEEQDLFAAIAAQLETALEVFALSFQV